MYNVGLISFPQVQPNNYSTFYDDQRQNWSIMFESEKAAMDFSKQVTAYSVQGMTCRLLFEL